MAYLPRYRVPPITANNINVDICLILEPKKGTVVPFPGLVNKENPKLSSGLLLSRKKVLFSSPPHHFQ